LEGGALSLSQLGVLHMFTTAFHAGGQEPQVALQKGASFASFFFGVVVRL
jgi:hypothetical protein